MKTRPPLQLRTGRFFRWGKPAGWSESESTNGVTLTSPDGKTIATSAILLRSPGSSGPKPFLLWMLPQVPGLENIKVTKVTDLPDQPTPFGPVWKLQEIDATYSASGTPVRARYTVGVCNQFGASFDAAVVGFHAPVADFDASASWLSRVAQLVTIANAKDVAGNDTLVPVRNNPLDNSGLIESWREKGLSEDRISKARREATSGYERVRDSTTGQVYEMPLEAWDSSRGGYLNPVRPTELLESTRPGE